MKEPLATIIPAAGIDGGHYGQKYTWGRTSGGEIMWGQFPSDFVRTDQLSLKERVDQKYDGFLAHAGGADYFVGEDVRRLRDIHTYRVARPGYVRERGYKAMLDGSLGSIARRLGTTKLKILSLTVGLPVVNYFKDKDYLREIAGGTHTVTDLRLGEREYEVEVVNVTVVPQPIGALWAIDPDAKQHGEIHFVWDLGGGTFDWFVADSHKPLLRRCGSVALGMLQCAAEAAEHLARGSSRNREILDRVDRALFGRHETVDIRGKTYPMSQAWPVVEASLERALTPMIDSIGDLDDAQMILLTGGGAPALEKVAKARFPEHAHLFKIDSDPVSSNVRGFHIASED